MDSTRTPPLSPPPSRLSSFRLALGLGISTFVLLGVGGTVNPSGSSLACPDWPTCFGSFFPEMTGGVQFEHTHRAVATFVGLLTLLLAYKLWRERELDPTVSKLGFLAVAMVIVQGVLGGITVLLELPPAVSMAHLALSMLFFALTIFICFRIYSRTRRGLRVNRVDSALSAPKKLCAWAAGAVYLQILLGGLVRHTREGMACGMEIPWCNGAVWPAGAGQIHMLHRYTALLVTAVVFAAAVRAFKAARATDERFALWTAALAPVLVLLQIGLGVLTVTTAIGLVEVTAHLAVGALLFADMIVLYLALGSGAEGVGVQASPRSEPAVQQQIQGAHP